VKVPLSSSDLGHVRTTNAEEVVSRQGRHMRRKSIFWSFPQD